MLQQWDGPAPKCEQEVYTFSSPIPPSSQLEGSPRALWSRSSLLKSYFVVKTCSREAERALFYAMHFNEMKLGKVKHVLKMLHPQLGLLTLWFIRLLQAGTAGLHHFRALETVWASRAVGRLTLPSALAGVPGAQGEGSEHCRAKETSSPAAPINALAKGCKIALAGSVPDGADALSSCCAGRQDSWLGIQSDAHLDAKGLCSIKLAWTGGRGVCYY